MPDLPEALDRYRIPTPYEVLSVPPGASAVEIRDRHNELKDNLNMASMGSAERAQELQRLDAAYDRVRVATNRMRVDFFLLDPAVGRHQLEEIARSLARPETTVEGLIKPRTFRVSPVALLDDLAAFVHEPQRVTGLHPQPMAPAGLDLPEPLAITFDC